MSYIFISYSHEDKEYAHRLEDELNLRDFEVWLDDRIDVGSQWPEEIEQRLDGSTAFILVMTPRSKRSKWVKNELERAIRKKKNIFPLLLEGGEPWLSVEATQYVDVRDGNLPPIDFYDTLARVMPKKVATRKPSVSESSGQTPPGPREIKEFIADILLQNVQKTKLPQTIPEFLNMPDIMKEHEGLLNEHFGKIDDPAQKNVLIKICLYGIALYEYRQIIMERGESNKVYKYKLFNAQHTFRAWGDYRNELGQKCRRYRSVGPDPIGLFGFKNYNTELTQGKMCRVEGRWEEVK